MSKIIDGWHTVKGYRVEVEDGYIIRGHRGEGVSYQITHPYKWNKQLNCWVICDRVKVSTFRNSENYKMA